MTQFLTRQLFLIIGLIAVAYFFIIDLKSLRPGWVDYVIFAVGFVAMAIYVIQSFARLRRRPGGDGSSE